jgi:SOS response regulatory protein OraA/RecX
MIAWNIEEAFKDYKNGTTLRELGQRYGISHERVRQKLSHLKAKENVNLKRVLCKRCKNGMLIPLRSSRKFCPSCAQIIKKTSYAHNQCECGKPKYRRAKKCAECSQKYSHKLAQQFIKKGFTVKSIAKVFSVTPAAIYSIKKAMVDKNIDSQ